MKKILSIILLASSLFMVSCSNGIQLTKKVVTETELIQKYGQPLIEVKHSENTYSTLIYKKDNITTWYFFNTDGELIGTESNINNR